MWCISVICPYKSLSTDYTRQSQSFTGYQDKNLISLKDGCSLTTKTDDYYKAKVIRIPVAHNILL